MTLKEWPKQEKPRERWLQHGPQALSDTEILALLLNTGLPNKNAIEIARDLLVKCRNLGELSQLSWQELTRIPGIGQAKALRILAALEFARRCSTARIHTSQPFTSTEAMASFFQERLACAAQEIFACLFLDNNLRVIHYEELFKGSINQLQIYAREILKQTLSHNAAALVIAHNHPRGPALPSPADIHVTKELSRLLLQIDVTLLDHLIIGDLGYYSFATYNQLPSKPIA